MATPKVSFPLPPDTARLVIAVRDPDIAAQIAEHAIESLRQLWGEHAMCPYCKHDSWAVSALLGLPSLDGSGIFPVMPVLCQTCGNSVLVSAMAMGIVSPSSE